MKNLDKLNLVLEIVLSSSQFSLLPHLLQKMMLVSQVVKSDVKIIILLSWSKSLIHFDQKGLDFEVCIAKIIISEIETNLSSSTPSSLHSEYFLSNVLLNDQAFWPI